jgi:hypothetical protein
MYSFVTTLSLLLAGFVVAQDRGFGALLQGMDLPKGTMYPADYLKSSGTGKFPSVQKTYILAIAQDQF